MTRIILIRHGEVEANIGGISQGHLESRLTPLGKTQGKETRERLKSEGIDTAYSSDSDRAVQTTRLILAGYHPHTILRIAPELREQCKGKYEGWTIQDREREIERILAETGEVYHNFRPEDGWGPVSLDPRNRMQRFYRGESIVDMQKRIVKYYKRLLEMYPHDCISITSHGMALSSLLLYLKNNGEPGQQLDKTKEGIPENGSVTIFEVEDTKRPSNIRWVVENDVSHITRFHTIKHTYGL